MTNSPTDKNDRRAVDAAMWVGSLLVCLILLALVAS